MNDWIGKNERGLGFAGGLLGLGMGHYAGLFALIPLAATGLVWWLSSRMMSADRKPIIPVLAVTAGQLIWMALSIFSKGGLAAVGLDILCLGIGLIWLIRKPGIGPVIFLAVLQALSLAGNAAAFASAAPGSLPHKVLLVSMLMRGLALLFLARLFGAVRRRAADHDGQALP